MSFKKNSIPFISNRKQNRKSSLQPRTPHLEALEDRQLLDAIGFTSVEQTTFQATFSNQESTESRYLILEVRAADGVKLSKDFTVSIRDASAAEGEGAVKYISSKIENNTASFLANYIISNDKTYVFEVGSELEDQAYEVRFVMAGDLNGDNVVSESEYYQLKGLAYVGQGTNAAFIERFNTLYGVKIPREVDSLYDPDGNGKLDMATFRKVIEPNFKDTIVLDQEITTIPTISSLKVGGETPAQVEGSDFTFVSNKNTSISGTTKAKTCDFTYTTADGTYSVSDFDLTQSSGEITLTNQNETAGGTLVFNYTNQDGTFTITPTSGQLPEGTLEMNLDNDFETNLYTIIIDQTAPKIQASKAYIGDTPNEDNEYYTNQTDFDLKVNYTLEGDAATLADVLAAEPYGLYIHVSEGGEEIGVKRLTQASDAFVPLTGVIEGAHTYTVKITDLAGSVYGTGTVSVVVNADFTAPTLAVKGYEVPEGKDHMTVTSQTVTLTPKTDPDATVSYTGDLEYTESDGAYTFTLAEGLNTISFTATDQVGNSTSASCKVYYEEELKLTQGENVTEYVSTQTGSLNLYDYFNYQSDLTFEVTCPLQNLKSFTEDSQKPGTYNYKFKQAAIKTTSTESIVVIAKTASGEQAVTLHINLTYSTSLWADVTVQDELENLDLHIVKTDGITLQGKLVNPSNPGIVNVSFADEQTPIIANVDLAELYAQPDHTKVYDAWRLTFTKDTEDETGFTLTLNKVNEDGETVPLEDGKYTLDASEENGKSKENVVVYRYADPAPTCLAVSIENENDPTPKFGVSLSTPPTELDLMQGVTVSVYSDASTLLATTTVTFNEDGTIKKVDKWDYKVQALEEGKYTFTYKFTNVSQEVETVPATTPYIVDKTAPVITVNRGETALQNEGNEEIATDTISLDVTVTDTTGTTVVCKMYNKQDQTDNGTTFDPTKVVTDGSVKRLEITDLVLAYPDTRIVIEATDEMGNPSTWTYEFLCKPTVSGLVQNGKYDLVQTVGAAEKTLDLHDLFIFSGTKSLSFHVDGPEGGWALSEDGMLSIQWDELSSNMTLTVTASIGNEELTKVAVSVIASKAQDEDYPRWIDLTTDGTTLDETFVMNLTTGKTITGTLYDSSGIDTASLAIYQANGTQPVATVGDLQQQMGENNQYTLDLTTLTDDQGQPLELADGEYEIHFYGKDANANPKESTEGNGEYQTIPFVVTRAQSVVWSAAITSTNGRDSDYVNALEFTLSGEGEISDWDNQHGLTVTVTGVNANGTKTVNLWKGIYQNGAWVSGENLRTDTTFSVDPEEYEMEDGQWTFTVTTTNAAQTAVAKEVKTVLDTVPPVITSFLDSLDSLDFNSRTKEQVEPGSSAYADSMSWEAPEWTKDPVIDPIGDLQLNVPATGVTRTYSKVKTNEEEPLELVNGALPLDYDLNTLKVTDQDQAGNESSKTYKIVYNSAPSYAHRSDIFVPYSASGMQVNLANFISDEAKTSLVYAATITDPSSLSASCTSSGLVTLATTEAPSEANPILSGTLAASPKDEYGANPTLGFTVNLVSSSSENFLRNLQLDDNFPITTKSGAKLTCDLVLPKQSDMQLSVKDEAGIPMTTLELGTEGKTFSFNNTEGGTFTCEQLTDIQYALKINFVENSLDYGTYSLWMDGKKLGEFVRRQTGLDPSVPVVSQDSIELPLGENHFTIERQDANTWSLVFEDGPTVQVTGENVYADPAPDAEAYTELWGVGSLSPDVNGQYTLPILTSELQLVFMNYCKDSNGHISPISSSPATINLEYADSVTVIDESLDISRDTETKLLGTYSVKEPCEFKNLKLASIEIPTIPPDHAITKIDLDDAEKFLVVTYNAYNVTQDRSPITVTAKTTDGETLQFNVCMPYEKPFTLVASVTKPYEVSSRYMYEVDTPIDYSQREYDVNDEDDADQLNTFKDFHMEIWLKVDLPIVSKKLYKEYGISDTNNRFGFNTTINVTGGTLNLTDVKSRSMFDPIITTDGETGETSVFARVAMENLPFLSMDLCACGTDGNYSCILELVVTPNEEGVSPVFTISFDKEFHYDTSIFQEWFYYYTFPNNPNYNVNPKQINDGISSRNEEGNIIRTFQLKYKGTEPEAQPAPLAAPALQVETAFAMPQSAVAEIALLEDVDSLSPAVQSSAPVSAPAENASPSLTVESWIQNGDESLGCTTLLSSGIVDKDALIDSLASSPAIQQTANAIVDSIFEEENA